MGGGGRGGGEGWEENRQSEGKPHAVAVFFERSAEQRPHLSLSLSLWCLGFLFFALQSRVKTGSSSSCVSGD